MADYAPDLFLKGFFDYGGCCVEEPDRHVVDDRLQQSMGDFYQCEALPPFVASVTDTVSKPGDTLEVEELSREGPDYVIRDIYTPTIGGRIGAIKCRQWNTMYKAWTYDLEDTRYIVRGFIKDASILYHIWLDEDRGWERTPFGRSHMTDFHIGRTSILAANQDLEALSRPADIPLENPIPSSPSFSSCGLSYIDSTSEEEEYVESNILREASPSMHRRQSQRTRSTLARHIAQGEGSQGIQEPRRSSRSSTRSQLFLSGETQSGAGTDPRPAVEPNIIPSPAASMIPDPSPIPDLGTSETVIKIKKEIKDPAFPSASQPKHSSLRPKRDNETAVKQENNEKAVLRRKQKCLDIDIAIAEMKRDREELAEKLEVIERAKSGRVIQNMEPGVVDLTVG